jgi:hypothetical protein
MHPLANLEDNRVQHAERGNHHQDDQQQVNEREPHLQRRVVDLAVTRGLAGVRCDHTSVLRWLAGEQPRPPVPELVAEALSNALGRKVSGTELGMTPSNLPGDLGLRRC